MTNNPGLTGVNKCHGNYAAVEMLLETRGCEVKEEESKRRRGRKRGSSQGPR